MYMSGGGSSTHFPPRPMYQGPVVPPFLESPGIEYAGPYKLCNLRNPGGPGIPDISAQTHLPVQVYFQRWSPCRTGLVSSISYLLYGHGRHGLNDITSTYSLPYPDGILFVPPNDFSSFVTGMGRLTLKHCKYILDLLMLAQARCPHTGSAQPQGFNLESDPSFWHSSCPGAHKMNSKKKRVHNKGITPTVLELLNSSTPHEPIREAKEINKFCMNPIRNSFKYLCTSQTFREAQRDYKGTPVGKYGRARDPARRN
ncbi:hypothetical protein EDB87DRAFT_1825822 [Lactarius vividus]|nr:hypothetical protein EDB87DRAFT_1825822 [Lactarius vividus]